MDKKAKEIKLPPQPPIQEKEKVNVDKEYLQYRLEELVKANSNVINEYSYLMSVLHPPLPIVKE